ncbi:MAG TPA: hypothetical protein PKD54_02155, partial [Pirellulaceae bacterium]|nr:hypothetical protein [Pirellulaceae bacterium]
MLRLNGFLRLDRVALLLCWTSFVAFGAVPSIARQQDALPIESPKSEVDPWNSIYPRIAPAFKWPKCENPILSSELQSAVYPFVEIDQRDAARPLNFAAALTELGCDPNNPLKLSNDQLARLTQASERVTKAFMVRYEELRRLYQRGNPPSVPFDEELAMEALEIFVKLYSDYQRDWSRAITEKYRRVLNDRQNEMLRERALANALY